MTAPQALAAGSGEASRRSICDVLRREVVTLQLRPGERPGENDLAGRFGTSPAPVREVLIRLVEDGLIEVRPQRGSFVGRISLCAAEQGIPGAVHDQMERTIAEQEEAADPGLVASHPDLFLSDA